MQDLCFLKLRLLLAMVLTLGSAIAVPYYGDPFTYTQPDGEKVPVRLWGDEFFAYQETEDGYLMIRDPKTRVLCYANINGNGDFVSTGVRVGQAKPPGLKPKQRLSPEKAMEKSRAKRDQYGFDENGQLKSELMEKLHPGKAEYRNRKTDDPLLSDGIISGVTQYAPAPDGSAPAVDGSVEQGTIPVAPEGDAKAAPSIDNPESPSYAAPAGAITPQRRVGLVLLASFPDRQAYIPKTPAQIDAYCNAENYTDDENAASVYKYFHIQSNGKLEYRNVVTAWFVAKNNRSYYGGPLNFNGPPALVKEGLAALQASGFNFKQCDGNGDNVIDAVNLLYAEVRFDDHGEGLWPGQWNSTWDGFKAQGMSANFRYQWCDLPSAPGIATFCHENGHLLFNFPDLYPLNGNSANVKGYSLMADSQETHPGNFDPFIKAAAGWADVIELNNTSSLRGVVQAGRNRVYRYKNPAKTDEAFLFEARHNSGYEGLFGGAIKAVNPTSGLVAYHAYNSGTNTDSSIRKVDNPNCNYSTPFRLLVLEANPAATMIPWYDNPMPGSNDAFHAADKSEISDSVAPYLKFWNTTTGRTNTSQARIHSISAAAETMSFSFGAGDVIRPAELGLTAPALVTATTAGVNPASQSFAVYNVGTGSFSYTVSDNATWLSVSPGSGDVTTDVDKLTVTYSATDLTAGTYYAEITINAGAVINSPKIIPVTLMVRPAFVLPVISVHPASTHLLGDASHTLTVTASGYPTVFYRWLKNGVPIAGTACKNSLTLNNVTASDAADYSVEVTNLAGTVTSNPAHITVDDHPYLTRVTPSLATAAVPANMGLILHINTTDDAYGGSTLVHIWSVISTPAGGSVKWDNQNSSQTAAVFSTNGVYGLRYSAYDGVHTRSLDYSVTMGATSNAGPTVDAGPAVSGNVGSLIALDGTVTHPSLPLASISTTWSVIAGPGSADFANRQSTDASVWPHAVGTYVLRLTANDGKLTTFDQTTCSTSPNSGSGSVSFTSESYSMNENSGTFQLPVMRPDYGGLSGAVSVSYAVSGGTATGNNDYTVTPGTLSWANQEGGVKFITLNLTDDTVQENAETIIVSLSNPTGGASLAIPSVCTLTITDNEVPVEILLQDNFNASNTDVNLNLATRQTGTFAPSGYTRETGTAATISSNKLSTPSASGNVNNADFEALLKASGVVGFSMTFDLANTGTTSWVAPYLSTHTGIDETIDDRGSSRFGMHVSQSTSSTALTVYSGVGSNQSSTDVTKSTLQSLVGATYSTSVSNNYSFVATPTSTTTGTYDLLVNGVEVLSGLPYLLGDGGRNGQINWEVRNNSGGKGIFDNLVIKRIPNSIPQWNLSPFVAADATVGSAYSFSIAAAASDGNGQPLSYAKVSGPAWLNVASNGALSGTPNYWDGGPNVFTVSVTDGIAAPVQAILWLTVNRLQTTVPDVLGGTQGTATSNIIAARLAVGAVTTQHHETLPTGSVISQSPSGGTSVVENSTVDLVISLGRSITVTFDANGGNAPNPTSMIATERFTYGALATTSRAGYSFAGWFTAVSGGSQVSGATIVTNTANHTLYAQWNALPLVSAGVDQSVVINANVAWNPSFLQTLAWYDAADVASITAVNGLVSQWNDKSGNKHHATQGTATSRPTTGLVSLNGLNTVDFDGVNDGLMASSLPINNQHTIYAVAHTVNNTGYREILRASPVDENLHFGQLAGSFSCFYGDGTTWPNIDANTPNQSSTVPAILGVVTHGTSATPYYNGTAQNSRGCTLNGTLTGFAIGSIASANFWDGPIAELVIVPTALSASDRQKFEGYLAHKWGLSANLPGAHPFKSATPTTASAMANLNGTVSDPENDALTTTWSKVSGPGVVAFTNASAVDTTVNFTQEGFYTLRLTATDGIGTSVDDVIITVGAPGNSAPVWSANPIAGSTATESMAYSDTLAGRVTDPDGQTLTFAKVSGPTWLSVAANGALSGTPGSSDRGDNVFTVSVSDGIAAAVQATLQIKVQSAFERWAGEDEVATFAGDSNNDGLADGLAWLLGAAQPAASANALVPAGGEVDQGKLIIGFDCLKASKRGTAKLTLQHSNSLAANSWTSVQVPETSGTVDGVVFTIAPIDGSDLNEVQATIPASAAGGSGKVFVRLSAEIQVP